MLVAENIVGVGRAAPYVAGDTLGLRGLTPAGRRPRRRLGPYSRLLRPARLGHIVAPKEATRRGVARPSLSVRPVLKVATSAAAVRRQLLFPAPNLTYRCDTASVAPGRVAGLRRGRRLPPLGLAGQPLLLLADVRRLVAYGRPFCRP